MVDESIRKGLGASEAKIVSDMVAEGKRVFSIGELAQKAGSREKARRIASRLVRKKWLERLGKGVYLVLELAAGSKPEWTEDSYYIASKLISPYYIGYYNMLGEYGWTEQIPSLVNVVTTKKLRSRVIHGVRYNFITLSRKKFFGMARKSVRGREIMVSDPEKTLVDALDHPEYCGGIGEVAKALYNAKQVDWHKLIAYGERMRNGAIFKRLGYLLELMEIPLAEELKEKIRARITKGYAPLSPETPAEGRHDSRWNVLINVEITKERVLA